MSAKICVVGSINADLTVNVERHPIPGETLMGAGGGITAGGKGANQACAAARLGASVALVGAVGTDANAKPATALLREADVDLTHVEEVTEVTGLAVITVAANGENTVLVVPGANALVDDTFVARHSTPIESADVVLLQEIGGLGLASMVLVVLFPVIQPWYCLWAILPLAAWMRRRPMRTAVVVISTLFSFVVLPRGLALPSETVAGIYTSALLALTALALAAWAGFRSRARGITLPNHG